MLWIHYPQNYTLSVVNINLLPLRAWEIKMRKASHQAIRCVYANFLHLNDYASTQQFIFTGPAQFKWVIWYSDKMLRAFHCDHDQPQTHTHTLLRNMYWDLRIWYGKWFSCHLPGADRYDVDTVGVAYVTLAAGAMYEETAGVTRPAEWATAIFGAE